MGVDRVGARLRRARRPRLWTLQRPGEALTLLADRRAGGVQGHADRRAGPAPGGRRPDARHAALGGADRPRRAAPTRSSAWPTWSARPLRVGDRLCARSFQAAVGCVDADTRHAAAGRATSAAVKASAATRSWSFGADATDRITAWKAANGEIAWTSERCCYRGLSAPLLASGRRWSSATVEGYVHLLSTARTASRCCACPPTARRWSAARCCRARRCWWSRATAACLPSGPNELRAPSSRTQRMKPVLAIVGRPNVGKSTLFNRLTKSRDAIVADFAGLTRDRHYGDARLGGHEFIVVDTGGFEPTAPSGIVREMAKQTRQAVAEADVVIFVRRRARRPVGAGPRHRALPARHGKTRAAGGQQGRGHERIAAAGRVPRTRHGRAAPGFGRARPGHPQPARSGARRPAQRGQEPPEERCRRQADPPGRGRPARTSASRR